MSSLLGDDGRGYELARKLEIHGVWRPWLGDAIYPAFAQFLSSPAAWEAFMRADESKTKTQIQMQLRVRALLFDKASASLFNQSQSPANVSKINPNYLELHGDDVYFTFDNGSQDGEQLRQVLAASNPHSSKRKSEVDAVSQRYKREELPETWYTQFFDKYTESKSYRVLFGNRELERSPEQMSTYLKVVENHRKRRVAFLKENKRPNSVMSDSTIVDEINPFLPETTYTFNCVPDSSILHKSRSGLDLNNRKLQFNGVLDSLPQITPKNPTMSRIMIERFGIRSEYLNMDPPGGGFQSRARGCRKIIGEEQSSAMAQKVVARLLATVGFESSSQAPLEVFGQLLSCHVEKLGRVLKLLADSYRKQCSANELIKMFLQTEGYSNLGTLTELVKDHTKPVVQQTHQQVLGPLSSQHQLPIQQAHQIPKQLSSQMLQQLNNPQSSQMLQQLNNPHYLAFQKQQQWERMRIRQQQQQQQQQLLQQQQQQQQVQLQQSSSTRPIVQVKMENTSDFPIDTNAYTALTSRHPQMQQHTRQQQFAAISSLHAQTNNAFRPTNSIQIPQVLSPTMGMSRAPPVIKVEGFQDLMGASTKHDAEENRLMSPK